MSLMRFRVADCGLGVVMQRVAQDGLWQLVAGDGGG
jgi:hypothetical protein